MSPEQEEEEEHFNPSLDNAAWWLVRIQSSSMAQNKDCWEEGGEKYFASLFNSLMINFLRPPCIDLDKLFNGPEKVSYL